MLMTIAALGMVGLSLLILVFGDRNGDRHFRACKAYLETRKRDRG